MLITRDTATLGAFLEPLPRSCESRRSLLQCEFTSVRSICCLSFPSPKPILLHQAGPRADQFALLLPDCYFLLLSSLAPRWRILSPHTCARLLMACAIPSTHRWAWPRMRVDVV